MKTSPFPRLCALLALALLALAPAAPAAAIPGPSHPVCTSSIPGHASDFLNYTLTLTFPTTGYHLSLLGTTLNKDTVNISVHYTLDPGAHGQIVMPLSVKFVQIAPRLPSKFTVVANGVLLGPAQKITSAN